LPGAAARSHRHTKRLRKCLNDGSLAVCARLRDDNCKRMQHGCSEPLRLSRPVRTRYGEMP